MPTVAQALLGEMLRHSLSPDEDVNMEHQDLSNILRIRVLEGEDITADEMLFICNQIRQGRRSAAPTATSTRKRPVASENLTDLLDQAL
jgi:hypothetical protein